MMKKNGRQVMCWLIILLALILHVAVAAGEKGDVNSDGMVNISDAGVLRKYLAGDPVGVDEANSDMNSDAMVDLKDLILLERQLDTVWDGTDEDPSEGRNIVNEIVYGQSEMGRDLKCVVMEPTRYSRTVLANFAIHGFEDWYDHDGQVLKNTAELVIDHFRNGDLKDCRLVIVPCANPDGLLDGYTKDGFGRCNANGVDLNRDFDAAHIQMTNSRNYTLSPFSASESRALRDLVITYTPDVVLDCHGWLNYTIGDSELAKVFYEEMGLAHHRTFSDAAHGYFSYWAHKQGALALLVEYTSPDYDQQLFINAMERLVSGEYEHDTGEYISDEDFSRFSQVKAYTISTENVDTYKSFDGEKEGKIFGTSDLCTIEKFYQNGWVRVNYPISSGGKIAFCPLEEFIAPEQRTDILRVEFSQNETVYRREDLQETLGTVYSTDEAYQVAKTKEAVQILYPLDSGGWKMGWVPETVIEDFSAESALLPYITSVAEDGLIEGSSLSSTGQIRGGMAGAVPGQEFTLPVLLSADDLIGLRMWVLYDESVLELEGIENGDILAGMTSGSDMSGNLYCVLWADSLKTEKKAIDGTAAVLRFKVQEDACPQDTEIQLLIQDGDAIGCKLSEVSINREPAHVTIYDKRSQVLNLPEDTVSIEKEVFAGSSFSTAYLMSGSLRTISDKAFADCKNLKDIYIPNSVTAIAADAFEGADNSLTVHGEEGSYAEFYAGKNGFQFVEE